MNVFKYIEKQALISKLTGTENAYEWQSYASLIGDVKGIECIGTSRR